jgi:ADP-ribose pyrophosphatase YjhB (NUDIX family)
LGAYCPDCGHATEKKTIEGRQLDVCPGCGHVQWRNPVVATMVLVETPGGLVLGRRAIDPGRGLWCLPGGFVNDDEHPERAAERECEEEIAAGVALGRLLGVYHVIRGDGTGMIALAYLATLARGASPRPGHEMLEVDVFPLDALPELAFDSHRRAIADYEKLVRLRARVDG